MPTPDTLEKFIARVEQNAHVEALEEFYTADSTMQENQSAPRVGREDNMAKERRVRAKAKGEEHTRRLVDYGVGAQILTDLGVKNMILLTNTSKVVVGLEGYGLHILEQRPIKVTP